MECDDLLPDEYEMCCGKRHCPTIKLENDGVSLSDNVGGVDRFGPVKIRMNREQASELKKWLEQKGF